MTPLTPSGAPVDLDGRALRYFVVLAEELNFTRAARRLHVAQQTLSDSIRHLESLVGVRLLDRSPRSVSLTVSGRCFLDDAREILAAGDAAVHAARRTRRTAEHSLIVGTPDWPMGIERFRASLDAAERDERVTVEVSMVSWLKHLGALRSGSIDVGVTFVPNRGALPTAVASVSLGVEPANCFVVALTHELAQRDDPTLADLAECRLLLIARDQSPLLHDHLVQGLRARGVEPRLDLDRSSQLTFAGALTHAALHGSAVWAVKSMTEPLPPGLVTVEIPELDLDVECVAISRVDDTNPAVQAFIDTLTSM